MLIAESVKYSDSLIVAGGLLAFSSIFVLNIVNKSYSEFLISQILNVAISVEGVFVGYQLFRIRNICLFCISIFSIFVILALIKMFKKKDFFLLSGFISFFSILALFYLLKPVVNNTPILDKPLVLIYKQNCVHCERVIEEAKKNKINIYIVKADNCLAMLKSLNIKEVPLLIVSKKGEKKIIIGERNILQYLLSKKNIPKNDLYKSIFRDKEGFCTIGKKCK